MKTPQDWKWEAELSMGITCMNRIHSARRGGVSSSSNYCVPSPVGLEQADHITPMEGQTTPAADVTKFLSGVSCFYKPAAQGLILLTLNSLLQSRIGWGRGL